jgi:hypothetical protein
MRLGIDFGTTNSGAAFVLNGKLEHVAFGAHRDYLPSSVFLKPGSASAAALPDDDALLIGYAADNSYPQDPRRYWRAFKRDLGHKDSINLVDRDVSIIEMIAAVIKALKAEAENVLGPLSQAVVTLPATYGPYKEQLMREAVERAGFKEASVEFLPEPVAAATYNAWIAQDLLGQRDGDVVLIYDLGGGTFDSTLVTRQGEQYEVISSAGIEYCGGMDFDAMIYQRMLEDFKDKLDPIRARLREAEDEDSRLMQLQLNVHLQNEAQKVKHELTDQEDFGRMVPLVGLEYARFGLSRTDFNAMIDDKVMETIECCQQLVADARLSWEDVTVVLLVGGSTRIPYVREAIERELGLPVRRVPQPEKAVFYGAALHGMKQPAPQREYHDALKVAREAHKLGTTDVQRLKSLREELELGVAEAAAVEREVLGNTLEETSRRLEAKEQYRGLLAIAWADKRLEETEVRQLSAKARQLGLKKAEVSSLQREVMGDTISSIRTEQNAVDRLAREHGINLLEVQGTGSDGRITKQDLERFIEASESELEFTRELASFAIRTIHQINPEPLTFWQRLTGKEPTPVSIHSVVFSPDARFIASGSSRDNAVKLWSVRNQRLVGELTGHTSFVQTVAFSPDGRLIAASGGTDKTIDLWNRHNIKRLRFLSGHADQVRSVAFSPDGQLLASGSDDKTVRLWKVNTGESVKTLTGHTGGVYSVAFSPIGLLASSSSDKTVKLWDIPSRRLLRTLTGHTDWVRSVAFSPDGQLLASGSDDDTVKLWNPRTGRLVGTLSGHAGWIYSVAFSPDGRLIAASGGTDKTIDLWDSHSGEHLRYLIGHEGSVNSVAFGSNGMLASSANDGKIIIWARS